ncbi:hypothetical protein [Streptomyces sp. NPDC007083]|uniref:hypothetical protein n=1 Tax=unclassified Streptomyces TaxID=2593676 RepID=UPI0033CA0153
MARLGTGRRQLAVLAPEISPQHLGEAAAFAVTAVDERGRIHLRNPHNENHPEPLTYQEFKKNLLPLYTTLEPK